MVNISSKKGLVSVIMPTYNTGTLLINSINSILVQTYSYLELIIIDDHSTDEETKKILESFSKKDYRVKIIYLEKNHGPSYARNIAIREAMGQYIAFCDSDDRWAIDKLELQIRLMQEKQCSLSCSSYYICDINQNIIGINIPPEHITLNLMKRDNKIGCTTAIYDAIRLGKKFYMPKLYKSEDWGLFLQIIKESKNCYAYIKKPLAYYCVRENSLSSNKVSMIKYNIAVYQKILGYSRIKSYLAFAFLFIPSYINKIFKRKHDSYKLDNKKK